MTLIPASSEVTVYASVAAGVAHGAAGESSEASNALSCRYDCVVPNAPTVLGLAIAGTGLPMWTWTSGGGGGGIYHYQIDGTAGTWTATFATSCAPASTLTDGPAHSLRARERRSRQLVDVG